MADKIEKLDFKGKIKPSNTHRVFGASKIGDFRTKEDLLAALKIEAADISVMDIMTAHAYLVEEGKYVQGNYKDEYLKAYAKGFILRVKEIRDNKDNFEGIVNTDELKEALDLLNEQEQLLIKLRSKESHFFKIYKIISIYTTFVLDEPIHIVGTPFPGGFKVKYENGTYLCPVKEKQKDNPGAVCGFCVAEQDESI